MFAEQIGFGFFTNRRLKHRGARRANALGPCESHLLGLAGGVLVHGHQRRHPFAFEVHSPHEVTGTFRCDEKNIHVVRRHDLAEVQRETVGDGERFALLQIGRDVAIVDFAVARVGNHNHDDVRGFSGVGDGENFDALFACHVDGFAAGR